FYVAKYVNKKSDMDLAAKGLGAKEWNNSLKTKLSLLPKKLFRIRMSRNFGMKMLTMTNLSTECLIRSEERFSRNAETDLVCRLLLEKKNQRRGGRGRRQHCARLRPGDRRTLGELRAGVRESRARPGFGRPG